MDDKETAVTDRTDTPEFVRNLLHKGQKIKSIGILHNLTFDEIEGKCHARCLLFHYLSFVDESRQQHQYQLRL